MAQSFRAVMMWVSLSLAGILGCNLHAEDTSVVPPGMIRVAVLGQLKKPGFKVLPAGATLDQVFAAAGGFPGHSDLDPDEGWPPVVCKVSRTGSDGTKEIFRMRIKIDVRTRVIAIDGRPFEVKTGDLITLSERLL